MSERKIEYEVPKDIQRQLSFTYSVDVVKFILEYLSNENDNEKPFIAVNLACEEKLTLVEFLKSIESKLNQQISDLKKTNEILVKEKEILEYKSVKIKKERDEMR